MSHQILSDRSLLKCWIVWQNGNRKTFYSYDTSGRYHVPEENKRDHGLRSLKKMVANFLLTGTPISKAIIYDNQTGQEEECLMNGQWVPFALKQEVRNRLVVEAAVTAGQHARP